MKEEKIELPKVKKPFSHNDYYRELKGDYNKKLDRAKELLEDTIQKIETTRRRMEKCLTAIKTSFGIDVASSNEWKTNSYIDGSLYRQAEFAYRNFRTEAEKQLARTFIRYCALTKTKAIEEKNVRVYNKILALDYKAYKEILRIYYYEVQHQMIANGYAYKFAGKLGWVCINRIYNNGTGKVFDTKGTKKRKEELIAQGLKPYNKDEALYCKLNNIPYNGVSYIQFLNNDCGYEFCLVNTKLPNIYIGKNNYNFEPANYWSAPMRKKTMNDIIVDSNDSLRYVTSLDIPFRRKLNICLSIDKTLYVNFIRNENQKAFKSRKNNSQG